VLSEKCWLYSFFNINFSQCTCAFIAYYIYKHSEGQLLGGNKKELCTRFLVLAVATASDAVGKLAIQWNGILNGCKLFNALPPVRPWSRDPPSPAPPPRGHVRVWCGASAWRESLCHIAISPASERFCPATCSCQLPVAVAPQKFLNYAHICCFILQSLVAPEMVFGWKCYTQQGFLIAPFFPFFLLLVARRQDAGNKLQAVVAPGSTPLVFYSEFMPPVSISIYLFIFARSP